MGQNGIPTRFIDESKFNSLPKLLPPDVILCYLAQSCICRTLDEGEEEKAEAFSYALINVMKEKVTLYNKGFHWLMDTIQVCHHSCPVGLCLHLHRVVSSLRNLCQECECSEAGLLYLFVERACCILQFY